ncbi:hypothetical protein NKH77_18825 [Streptomyces sp. M19]
MVASDRFAVYDEALASLPGFAVKPMDQAEAGEHRFMDRRHRRTSVTIPADLVRDPPGPPLTAERLATAGPLDVPLDELADVARWMDEEERRRGRKAGNWAQRLDDLDLDTRTPDGTAFAPASALPLDRLTHLVGMVGAGKSTLMTLLAVWAHHNGLRTTLVVGDVAEQLTLTELFRGLGLSAALIQGGTTRPSTPSGCTAGSPRAERTHCSPTPTRPSDTSAPPAHWTRCAHSTPQSRCATTTHRAAACTRAQGRGRRGW